MTDDDRKIVDAAIRPGNEGLPSVMTDQFRHLPHNGYGEVMVWYEGSEEPERLFGYYTDELAFRDFEFVGLTKREALDLFRQRDVAYLQS